MTQHFVMKDSRTADKFVVRLPEGMRERISDVAGTNHRSMNSEIISRLEQTLQQDGLGTADLQASDLSNAERELIHHFRELTFRQRNALIALIDLQSGEIREAA